MKHILMFAFVVLFVSIVLIQTNDAKKYSNDIFLIGGGMGGGGGGMGGGGGGMPSKSNILDFC